MRNLLCIVCLLLVAGLCVGCSQTTSVKPTEAGQTFSESSSQEPEDEPLLLADDDVPLLLDQVAEDGRLRIDGADNSRCGVCHLNLMTEDLALTHARADLGCADCHGPSDAHIADESWASGGNGTAPDIMFTKDRINLACSECHEDLPCDSDHGPSILLIAGADTHCTDCHGKHRLVNRKCFWK